MIPDHAPVLVRHVAPDRQCMMHALCAMLQHALRNVGSDLPIDEVEQGMQRPIGVPHREDGVVGKSIGLVDVVIQSSVLAIHIHIDAGVDHGVVERGVEHR